MGTCCVDDGVHELSEMAAWCYTSSACLEGIVFSIPVLECLYASSNDHYFYPLAHSLVGSFSAEFIS